MATVMLRRALIAVAVLLAFVVLQLLLTSMSQRSAMAAGTATAATTAKEARRVSVGGSSSSAEMLEDLQKQIERLERDNARFRARLENVRRNRGSVPLGGDVQSGGESAASQSGRRGSGDDESYLEAARFGRSGFADEDPGSSADTSGPYDNDADAEEDRRDMEQPEGRSQAGGGYAQCAAPPAESGAAADSLVARNPAHFWQRVGMSDQERACEAVFGMSLLDIWREKREEHCTSTDPDQSSLVCYRHHQLRHSGPDIMCDGRNIAIDFGRLELAGKGGTFGEDGHYRFPQGALTAVCERQPAFSLDKFPMSQKDVMSGLAITRALPRCQQLISHPVIPVVRYEYKNLFHQMTDFLNAFMVAELTGVDLSEAQILLLDNHPVGPFLDMWRAIAPSHPVLRAPDMPRQTVCFARLLFPVLGYGAPIAKDIARPNECTDGSLVQAFVRHVLKGMDLLSVPPPNQPSITLISRKDYDGRSLARKLANEDELSNAIRSRLTRGEYRAVDFAQLPFREQVALIRKTNVLIGMHGAGLSHLMFLPKEAIVIELFQGDAPKHYRNFAKWTDKRYMAYSVGPAINVPEFLQTLDGVVRLVRSFNEQHDTCGLQC